MGINLPCGNTPLTTNECGGDCDEKIERLAERVSEAEEKLDTIQEGAEVNVNADWDETDPDSDAYIENKPSVNYDLSLGDSAPTVGSAIVGSTVLGSLVDIILGRGDGTEDRVSVSGTGAIQITRDGDTMTIHVPVGEIDQLRNGTDTEARAWAANVLKQWLDERIAQIPADQFLDLTKTVFVNSFTWSSAQYPGSVNPNLDGKPVLVLALTDGTDVSYSFLNMEDLIDIYTGTSPISVSGNVISHDNSGVTAGSYGDASNQTPNFGDTFKALRSTVDAKGHVTSMSEHTVKIPDTLATQESAGLMSAEDKEKLDNVDQLYKTTCGNPIVIDDADGEVKALNVELTPIQAGTPRQDSAVYNEPYLSKNSPAFNSEYDKLVGGTVAWNQQAPLLSSEGWANENGTTSEYNNGVVKFTSTVNSNGIRTRAKCTIDSTHKFYIGASIKSPTAYTNIRIGTASDINLGFATDVLGDNLWHDFSTITKSGASGSAYFYIYKIGSKVTDLEATKYFAIDLTQMFGTTVADAIYALEQNEAGSGIAFLKSYDFFTNDYYPYNEGTLISAKPTAHVTSETYPLAGVDLRGIFKIADGKLYCDGDEYPSSGTITRKYGIVDLGTLTWGYANERFVATAPNDSITEEPAGVQNVICSKYANAHAQQVAFYNNQIDKCFIFKSTYVSSSSLQIRDTSYTDATAFKTAMSGVYLVYELATPTTETVTGFTSPQAVGSTESYTDNREVPIPVGHESRYADIFPIYPHTAVDIEDTNGTDTHTVTVPLNDLYGGTVDVIGGQDGQTTWGYVDLSAITGWYYTAESQIFSAAVPNIHRPAAADRNAGIMSDIFAPCPTTQINNTMADQSMLTASGQIYIRDTRFTDVASFLQAVSGHYLAYKLATPTPLTTTPTALTLYKGDNVISSDGDMCITYLQDRGDLTDFISDMKDCCEEVKGSMLKNLVDGTAQGSLRGIDTAQEDTNYTLGTDATALGAQTKASGDFSFAGGGGSTASSYGAFAYGSSVTASNDYAHAEGNGTTASGKYSHTEGASTSATAESAHSEGNGTEATAKQAHAEGSSTHATADNAHSEGGGTTASAAQAHSEGAGTTASAYNAHSEGSFTEASGVNSHTEGNYTKATVSNAHAEGNYSEATQAQAHAQGDHTKAKGQNSDAEGEYTIASNLDQHVGGAYNIEDTTGTVSTRGTYVEIIGNGTSDSARSNARTLDWNGNEALQGTLTLGKGTADEVTITAAQLQQLLALI